MYGGIIFDAVFQYKFASEAAGNAIILPSIAGLVEVQNSPWLAQLEQTDSGRAVNSLQRLKHYAVFIEDAGQFEFLAAGFQIIPDRAEKYYAVEVKL